MPSPHSQSATYGKVDSLVTSGTKDLQVIVDAGSPWTMLPSDVSKAINLAFSPLAFRYTVNTSLPLGVVWAVDCDDHTVPEVGIEIGGQIFWHNKGDLVHRIHLTEYTDQEGNGIERDICLSAIQDGFAGVKGKPNPSYVLGQPFLKNVIAVYDIGRMEMGFAARTEYGEASL